MVRARLGENNTRITDDPDYMKNYMKAYYKKNLCKEVISVTCGRCGYDCSVQKLKRHQETKLCKKRGEILKQMMDNEDLEVLAAQNRNEEREFRDFGNFHEFLTDFVHDKIKSEE